MACRILSAALPSSSLRSNGSLAIMIHNTVFYMLLVLRDFIVWTLLLSFQTCLILKSFLLRFFFNSSPSLFYRYCLLGHFFPLFSWKKAIDLHLLLLSFLIDYNKVPMCNLIGWKIMFYDSIKHGAKVVKSSLNHTIVSRRQLRRDWLSNGVVFKTEVQHFRDKSKPLKDTNEQGKFKWMLSFLSVD